MKILTAAEMREIDRLTTERYGIASLELMERAGTSVADVIRTDCPNFAAQRILVLCGRGNNGGDGFVVARKLAEAGGKPFVYLFAAPDAVHGDAAANLQRWQKNSGDLRAVRDAAEWDAAKIAFRSNDVIVDALLGTGVRGPVESVFQQVIRAVNKRPPGSRVFSVDVPSGLLADTSETPGDCIRADYTITFTAPKAGLVLGNGNSRAGKLLVREIGSPPELVDEIGKGKLRWLEPREFLRFSIPRPTDSNKGTYGHALIVAGSHGKSGAAALASFAALRVGAGLVTAAIPAPILEIVAAHAPELMTESLAATDAGTISIRCLENNQFYELVDRKNALAIGPGLSTRPETQEFVRKILSLRARIKIILDADGLNAFAGRGADLKGAQPIAITPHPGEMARLLGCSVAAIQSHRIETARKAAADWNVCVILKGYQTVIAAPDGRAWINSTGNPGMAKGGAGDALTGMLAGLTAEFGQEDWASVLCFGVYLHGLAGDLAAAHMGERSMIASDLIGAIPRAYEQFCSECGRA